MAYGPRYYRVKIDGPDGDLVEVVVQANTQNAARRRAIPVAVRDGVLPKDPVGWKPRIYASFVKQAPR